MRSKRTGLGLILACGFAVVSGILLGDSSVQGGVLLWEGGLWNGSGHYQPDGSNVWDNTTIIWAVIYSSGPDEGAPTCWVSGDDAYIGDYGTAGTITLASTTNVNVNNMTFGNVTGQYIITGGTINLGVSGTGLLTVNNNSTINSTLGGSGALLMVGPDMLTLGGSNTFTGSTTITGGTLQLGNPLALQNSTTILGGGVLDLNGYSATLGGLSGFGSLSLATGTLSVGNNGTSTIYSGALSGEGGLTKTGSGVLALSGLSGYTATTTVSSGVLEATTTAALPNSINVANGAVLAVQAQTSNAPNGWTNGNIDSLTSNSNVAFAAGSSLGFDVVGGDMFTRTSGFNLPSGIGLTKLGAGTLVLMGTNSFTGPTSVVAGNLQYSSSSALSPRSIITIDGGGAVNVVGAYTTVAGWLGSSLIDPASTGALAIRSVYTDAINMAGYSKLSLGAIAGGATFSGSLTPAGTTYYLGGGSGILTVSTALTGNNSLMAFGGGGGGTLILTGSNTYTGTTTVNGGTLQIGDGSTSPGLLPGSAVNILGALVFDTPATMNLACSGNISGTGELILAGGGIATLSGNNSFTGVVNVNSGMLKLGSSVALGASSNSLAISGGTLDVAGNSPTIGNLSGTGGAIALGGGTLSVGAGSGSSTFGGTITGAGGLTKIGGNSLTLAGTNTYNGPTTVNGGNLAYSSPSAVSPNSNILINSAGVVSGGYSTVAAWIGSGFINPASTGVLALSGFDTETVSMTGYSSLSLGAVAAGATFSGSLTPAGTTYRLGGGVGPLTYTPAVGGAIGLVVDGTLILTGSASYTGPTIISAGSLQFVNSGNQTLSGDIGGLGSVVVSGGGLTLAGSNTYTGVTLVNGGTISVSSATKNLGSTAYLGLDGTLIYTGTGTSDVFTEETAVNSGVINVLNPGTNLTFSSRVGWFNNSDAVLTKTGPGTLTLGGTGDNSGLYVYVQQVALVLAKQNSAIRYNHAVSAIGSVSPGALVQMGSIPGGDPNGGGQLWDDIYNMNGTLDFNGMNEGVFALTGTGVVTNNASSTTALMTFGWVPGGEQGQYYLANATFAGVLADGKGTLAVAVSGGGIFALTGTKNAYSGGTTITNGQLIIGDGSTSPGSLPGNVVISSAMAGALTFNTPAATTLTCSGNISGSGSLTKLGAGRLALTGNNSYGGGTTVSGGTLVAASPTAMGNGHSLVVQNAAAVDFSVGPYFLQQGGTLRRQRRRKVDQLHATGRRTYRVGQRLAYGRWQRLVRDGRLARPRRRRGHRCRDVFQ